MTFKNLPLNAKITCLVMMLAIASGASSFYASTQMSAVDATYSELINGPGKGVMHIAQSRRALSSLTVSIYQNILATTDAGNKEASTRFSQDDALFEDQLGQARNVMPELKGPIDSADQKYRAAMSGVCGDIIRSANETTDPAKNLINAKNMGETCDPVLTEISATLNDMIDATQKKVDEASAAAGVKTHSTQELLLIAIAIASLASIGTALLVTKKFITAPFNGLKTTMAEIGQGNLAVVVADKDRNDEVGAMAKTLDDLRVQLVDAERLRSEQAKEQVRREDRNRMIANAVQKFEGVIGKVVGSVTAASGQLEQAAESLTQTAGNTQQLSSTAAAASEQTSTNVQSVATASEQLAATVSEIARQVQQSAGMTNDAVTQAARTNEQVAQLSEAANRIGDVVNLINTIAGQTNLLALNATIEAARAGDAGKGFAVVAQEVKALAAQTAKATSEIAAQISSMQGATQGAVAAIHEIGVTINKVSSISEAIAAAVEEQEATTKEITRNVAEAARGTTEVATNITEVSSGAVATGSASSQVLSSAKLLTHESDMLSREVNQFLASIKAA